MVFIKKNGKEHQAKCVNDLFTGSNKKLRMDLFGSALSKEYDAEKILAAAENNVKVMSNQLQNLGLLKKEMEKQEAEKQAKEVMKCVDKMTPEQTLALLEKLQAKVAQK